MEKPFSDSDRATALFVARFYGDAELEAALWAAQHDVNAPLHIDAFNTTLLHLACGRNYLHQ